MSTPEPKESTPEAKLLSPTIGKEQEATVNGHTSPTPPSTEKEAQSEPAVNGSEAPVDGPNGISKKTEKSADSATPVAPAEKQPTPERTSSNPPLVEGSESETKPEAKTPKDSATPTKDGDVEMTDTTAQPLAVQSQAAEPPESKTAADQPNEPTQGASAMAIDEPETSVDVNGVKASDQKDTTVEEVQLATSSQQVDLEPASMSQLIIESQMSPAGEEVDVAMGDAPAAPSKMSRERDEDSNEEEPLAKRQRTEPREDEVMVSTTEEAKAPKSLDTLDKWTDEELAARPISTYQVREYKRAIASIKKTKAGGLFKDPVAKAWPGLAERYMAETKEPMDLSELDKRLREGLYSNLGAFKHDLGLLYTNSVAFNGDIHEVTQAGWTAVEAIWNKCRAVPAEEPPKSKQAKHMPSRHHEPRAATQAHAVTVAVAAPADAPPQPQQAAPEKAAAAAPAKAKASQHARRASSAAAAASPTEKAAEQQTFAVPPGGVPQIRRASTQTEGDRPKRAIHPPKPKDIDYTNKSATKKHQRPEMQFCAEVLRDVMDKKHYHLNAPFLAPVDPIALNIPTYFHIIKKPMDLSTIEGKLNRNEYSTEKQFHSDMELMFNNCFKFNAPVDGVYSQGKQLKSFFQAEWAKKDQWLAKHAPSKPASVVSETHSDEESEAGVEVAPPPTDDLAVRQMREAIEKLQEQLSQETNRMNEYYAQELPNENLVNAQNAIMSTLQKSLLEVKQKLAAHAHAHAHKQGPAPKSKAAKPAKPKGGTAAGANKKGGAGAGGRKSGGGAAAKKAPKKDLPALTESEKNEVAAAVGTLDSPHIEQAIAIIKKDTGQAENDSGELELDIEQLSQPALRKLWDICCKAIPGFKSSGGAAQAPTPTDSPAATAATKAGAGPKPKKRKPMHAQEQEDRIAAISNRLQQIEGGGGTRGQVIESIEVNAQPPDHDAESSDEDSEEE